MPTRRTAFLLSANSLHRDGIGSQPLNNIAFATMASSYYRWMPLGQETGVFGPGDRTEHMGNPRRGSGIQEGGYGPTERLRPTSALSARLDRQDHNRKLSRECYLAELIQ